MALVKRVESGCEGLSLHPNAPLKGEERKRKKAKCASVCLFMVSLMADFCGRQHHKAYPSLSVQIEAVA